jgi:hypothetical protein
MVIRPMERISPGREKASWTKSRDLAVDGSIQKPARLPVPFLIGQRLFEAVAADGA